jgi:hypothetical protein
MQQGSPTYESNRLRVAERPAIGKVFRRQSAFFFAHGGETSRESAPVGQVVKRSVVHYSAENPSSPGQKLGGALLAGSGGPPRRAPGRRKRLPSTTIRLATVFQQNLRDQLFSSVPERRGFAAAVYFFVLVETFHLCGESDSRRAVSAPRKTGLKSVSN